MPGDKFLPACLLHRCWKALNQRPCASSQPHPASRQRLNGSRPSGSMPQRSSYPWSTLSDKGSKVPCTSSCRDSGYLLLSASAGSACCRREQQCADKGRRGKVLHIVVLTQIVGEMAGSDNFSGRAAIVSVF